MPQNTWFPTRFATKEPVAGARSENPWHGGGSTFLVVDVQMPAISRGNAHGEDVHLARSQLSGGHTDLRELL